MDSLYFSDLQVFIFQHTGISTANALQEIDLMWDIIGYHVMSHQAQWILQVSSGDVVILGSDGLWDNISVPDISSLVRDELQNRSRPSRIAQKLVGKHLLLRQESLIRTSGMFSKVLTSLFTTGLVIFFKVSPACLLASFLNEPLSWNQQQQLFFSSTLSINIKRSALRLWLLQFWDKLASV